MKTRHRGLKISADAKILCNITKGNKRKRYVVGFGQCGGKIVLGANIFPQKPSRPNNPSERPTAARPAATTQTIFILNQTGFPITYNASLQPTGVGTSNFEGIQGELNPGTNAVKFSTKKAPVSGSELKLTLYMNYKQPRSPRVTYEKKSIESGSKPSISITTNIMGEPQSNRSPVSRPK